MTSPPSRALADRWQHARRTVDQLKREIGRKRRALHDAAAALHNIEDEARTLGVALVELTSGSIDEEGMTYGSPDHGADNAGGDGSDAGGRRRRW